jgi:NADH-quinone oxidoreductase subunit J
MGNFIVFAILAVLAISAAVAMVSTRNAVHSALALIANMVVLATFYVLLNAPFIAMVQIAVYAGAIMVLFLFVIMLLGAEKLEGIAGRTSWQTIIAFLLGIGMLFVLGTALVAQEPSAQAAIGELENAGPAAVGLKLFESYVFPFEVTSLLLLVAMVGVVVLRSKADRRGKDA